MKNKDTNFIYKKIKKEQNKLMSGKYQVVKDISKNIDLTNWTKIETGTNPKINNSLLWQVTTI